jgi:hypothetical protein
MPGPSKTAALEWVEREEIEPDTEDRADSLRTGGIAGHHHHHHHHATTAIHAGAHNPSSPDRLPKPWSARTWARRRAPARPAYTGSLAVSEIETLAPIVRVSDEAIKALAR